MSDLTLFPDPDSLMNAQLRSNMNKDVIGGAMFQQTRIGILQETVITHFRQNLPGWGSCQSDYPIRVI